MSKIIGIDLGTTNSCVAVLEGGEPTVIKVAQKEEEQLLSIAAFTKKVKDYWSASEKTSSNKSTKYNFSIKRFMGRTY